MTISRRGFLGGIIAAAAAPAIVKAEILMPVKPIFYGGHEIIWSNLGVEGVIQQTDWMWEQEPVQVYSATISAIVAETIRRRMPEMIKNMERNNALYKALSLR